MFEPTDPLIDQLIKPPTFVGKSDWSRTWKLVPNGTAAKDKIISTRLQPANE